MRSPVADLLADLDAAFSAVHAEWFLFGAQAAIVYGVARLTGDVDVTARVPVSVTNTALSNALEERGFRQRFDHPAIVEQGRVLPFVHVATSLPVDIVLSGPGLEDDFFARVSRHRLDDIDVPVVDVSDLIVMKVLAGRGKDVEDVIMESALGQSDLVPALEDAITRARPSAR